MHFGKLGKTVGKEVTNRNDVRAAIAAGGWEVVYGDLINEGDVLTFIISIPTGTVGGWVAQQVQDQLTKFSQSLSDVSDDIVVQATNYLEGLIKGKSSGETDIDGLGVKGGFATYNRHMEYYLAGRKPLPSHPPPAVPEVPPITADAKDRPTPPGKNHGSRLTTNGQTLNECGYLQSDNGVHRFICQSDGNVVLYGAGNTVIWQSHTDGRGYPPFRIVAQADRNIVEYDRNNIPLWRTGTGIAESGRSECVLVLQDDRNLVLYDPADNWKALWNTKTAV
ncbi:hypothetical protein N7540_006189 [Penicillium herquei]|nr:hypothetical protein N7540_006189 [Penicillium herquei]